MLLWVQSTDDYIVLTESGAGSGTQDIKIVKGANITFTYTDANNFTIAATNTNRNWCISAGTELFHMQTVLVKTNVNDVTNVFATAFSRLKDTTALQVLVCSLSTR